MLLAYMHNRAAYLSWPELCLVPHKTDEFTMPIRVDTLRPTDSAVYRLGPEEALLVEKDEKDGGTIIVPMYPAKLYLTLDLPQFPGMNVKQAKVLKDAEGAYKVFYPYDKDGETSWRQWIPNREKRASAGHSK